MVLSGEGAGEVRAAATDFIVVVAFVSRCSVGDGPAMMRAKRYSKRLDDGEGRGCDLVAVVLVAVCLDGDWWLGD